jgi:hypothetical protein
VLLHSPQKEGLQCTQRLALTLTCTFELLYKCASDHARRQAP